jgi:hypothetical protein
VVDLPEHVVTRRRDGRRQVLLHRSLAVISDTKVEIRSARSTVLLPLGGLVLSAGLITWMAMSQGSAPLWVFVILLLALLVVVPVCVMGLVSTVGGADVIVDAKKGSATWQQGYLGMGIGTKELVPFAKIDHLEVTVEGADGDRWRGEQDDLRQFALILVKASGKRLKLAQVPVPAYGQTDGMDRVLAVGQAVAEVTGSTVRIPDDWELVEVDTATGEPVKPAAAARDGSRRRRRSA